MKIIDEKIPPIITVSNQKGGVGKTSVTINLSGAFALQQKKVLLIDLDPQGNLTKSFLKQITSKTTLDIFHDKNVIAQNTYNKNIDIIPCDKTLSSITPIMSKDINVMFNLKQYLHRQKTYDVILIDTPPTLMDLSMSAIVSAKYLLIPLSTQYFSMHGTNEIIKTFTKTKKILNSSIEFLGCCISMHDKRTALSNEILTQIKTKFKDKVFKTIIPRTIKVEEAQVRRKTVIDEFRKSEVSKKYLTLSQEILSRIGI